MISACCKECSICGSVSASRSRAPREKSGPVAAMATPGVIFRSREAAVARLEIDAPRPRGPFAATSAASTFCISVAFSRSAAALSPWYERYAASGAASSCSRAWSMTTAKSPYRNSFTGSKSFASDQFVAAPLDPEERGALAEAID